MENASKALIYAGEILLGVILLTLMVFLFQAAGSFSDKVDKNIETKVINEFNAPLEKYRGKTDITVQDIVTIGNYAKQYNEQIGEVKLKVIVYNVESKYMLAHILSDNKNQQYEFIQKYSNDINTSEIVYFECIKMNYSEETGRINIIELKKIE